MDQACRKVSLDGTVTYDTKKIMQADAVILPGVGAFGDAMSKLRERDLVETIANFALTGRPILGVCLGMQLLMSTSEEFGINPGLNLVRGRVIQFPKNVSGYKIPQIQWNSVNHEHGKSKLFEGVPNGESMYFVHSYYVIESEVLDFRASASYADIQYCCAFEKANIFGVQFHPEKSGMQGLAIFENFKKLM